MDTTCVDPQWLLGQQRVTEDDRFEYDGKTCAMFNMDNCFECARQLGRYCGPADFERRHLAVQPAQRQQDRLHGRRRPGYADPLAGGHGAAAAGSAPVVGRQPGPRVLGRLARVRQGHPAAEDRLRVVPHLARGQLGAPLRLVPGQRPGERPVAADRRVRPDQQLHHPSRRAQRHGATTPSPWAPTRASRASATRRGSSAIPSTRAWPRRCSRWWTPSPTTPARCGRRCSTRTASSRTQYVALADWQTEDAALDTFWAVTYRAPDPANEVEEKRATRYYEYVDRDIHNGFIYFYSVTSTDHELLPAGNQWGITGPAGPGLVGDPGSSFGNTQPGTEAQTGRAAGRRRDEHLRLSESRHPRCAGGVPAAVPQRRRPHRRQGDVHQPAHGPQHRQDLHGGGGPGADDRARRDDRVPGTSAGT